MIPINPKRKLPNSVAYGLLGRLVMAVVGAMVLLWLIRVIKRRG
jgi:uncharacterized membrane protein YeaQ/YmgE (transglycosylase-associated protein family)